MQRWLCWFINDPYNKPHALKTISVSKEVEEYIYTHDFIYHCVITDMFW